MSDMNPRYLSMAKAIVKDGSSTINEFTLAEIVIAQHEEIESLKREIEGWREMTSKDGAWINFYKAEIEKLKNEAVVLEVLNKRKLKLPLEFQAVADEAYETAAQAAKEAILFSDDMTPLEYITNTVVEAISALKSTVPTNETGNTDGITTCQSGSDGDCFHKLCPQLRDGEPVKSGRRCPLDTKWQR